LANTRVDAGTTALDLGFVASDWWDKGRQPRRARERIMNSRRNFSLLNIASNNFGETVVVLRRALRHSSF
jgi:hypothetical protein